MGIALTFGILRNNTTAGIGNNTQVAARSNVDVNALANHEIDTIDAGGIAALAGSVSVWSILSRCVIHRAAR